MRMMTAARLYAHDEPMVIEQMPVPTPRAGDVLVKVEACGLVPNLGNVLAFFKETLPYLPLPRLPAIFGLDVSGVVSELGEHVQAVSVGDRVYVTPGLTCGACPQCRADDSINCHNFTFRGYFGFGPGSQALYDAYPYGGMSEYITAPRSNLVKLPNNVSFEAAARFGYLGTGLAALQKAKVGGGSTILIPGITGTLGLGTCLVALALGVTRILGVARNQDLIRQVEAIAPGRIQILTIGERRVRDWARELTGGYGVDGVVDCLGPGSSPDVMMDCIYACRRGGIAVNVNGIDEPMVIDFKWTQAHQVACLGSNWFTAGQGDRLAAMAEAGALDLSHFEHHVFPLAGVNDAINNLPHRNGGFSNFLIRP